MKITKIEQQKKNRKRYSVFLDGEFAFGLHQDLLLKIGLHTGDELSPQEVEDYQRQDQMLSARESAYRLLQYRQRSVHEMHERLQRKDFPAEIIESVIDDLLEKGLLDDRQFAETFAEDQLTRKNIGPIRLRSELHKKRLPGKIIDEVVHEMYKKYDVRALAEQAAAKKRRSLTGVDRETAYRRLTNYLARRGFPWEIISHLVDSEKFN